MIKSYLHSFYRVLSLRKKKESPHTSNRKPIITHYKSSNFSRFLSKNSIPAFNDRSVLSARYKTDRSFIPGKEIRYRFFKSTERSLQDLYRDGKEPFILTKYLLSKYPPSPPNSIVQRPSKILQFIVPALFCLLCYEISPFPFLYVSFIARL